MKTKDSKKTNQAFLTMIMEKNRPTKIWVDKGTKFSGEFRELCKAEGLRFYQTMSETKAASAERTKRSLKIKFYRYMEDNGFKIFHSLIHFVIALISRRNCSKHLIPKNVKVSDFLSIFYSKPLRDFRKLCLQLKTNFAFWSQTYTSARTEATIYTGSSWNCCKFFQKNSNILKKRWTGWDCPR